MPGKVYLLSVIDDYEGDCVFGAFSSEQKAWEWCDAYIINNFRKSKSSPEKRRAKYGFSVCGYEVDPSN